MSISLIVLAAGIGSRYGGLKQIDPVGPSGEIVIDYSVFDAIRAGFDHVVFVIRREIEKDFRAAIGARLESQIRVSYVFQELDRLPAGFRLPAERKKPWGTGHAILMCRDVVREPFAVLNADDFYGRESYRLLAGFLRGRPPGEATYAMVGFILRNTLSEHGTVARGICDVDSRGFLRSVVERTKIEKTPSGARFSDEAGAWHGLSGDELVSMNMWGFTPSIFDSLQEEFVRFLGVSGQDMKVEFFIPTVVDTLIREAKATARVLETPERWVGVTYPDDKADVVRRLRDLIGRGVYPERLWE
jgi:UTP-glucose-1-phosphate uridylyltransferase